MDDELQSHGVVKLAPDGTLTIPHCFAFDERTFEVSTGQGTALFGWTGNHRLLVGLGCMRLFCSNLTTDFFAPWTANSSDPRQLSTLAASGEGISHTASAYDGATLYVHLIEKANGGARSHLKKIAAGVMTTIAGGSSASQGTSMNSTVLSLSEGLPLAVGSNAGSLADFSVYYPYQPHFQASELFYQQGLTSSLYSPLKPILSGISNLHQ